MKIIKYISLIMFFPMLISCGDDVLELDNLGVQTAEVYYNDSENALAGLNACYSAMMADRYYVYGDIMSDDAIKGGSDMFDWVTRQEIREFTLNSGNDDVGSTWNRYYTTIVRSNEIINSLGEATFDEELKNRIVGEAKFLRAYAYSQLVPLFGPVPLVTGDFTVDEMKQPRASVDVIYELIKGDLDDAIEALPLKSLYDPADLGRATKGAARALKARALMQESSYIYNPVLAISGYPVSESQIWDEVYQLTSDIIASGEYGLTDNFAVNFEMEGENNFESVFEIQHKTTSLEWGESVGNPRTVEMGNRDDWGWCFNLPTDALYNAFGETDPRRECSIYGQEFDILYGEPQTWEKQEWTLEHSKTSNFVTQCRLNRKYALARELRHGNHNNQPNNKRVIRYADVLLMHAEAAYHKGLDGEARNAVNEIRARAEASSFPLGSKSGQTSNYTYDQYSGASVPSVSAIGEDLLEAIWHERRLELAMEGRRYFDLVRTGRTSLLPYEDNYTAHDGLLPIPIGDVNTFELEQNKGY
jgi:hypothetical protein